MKEDLEVLGVKNWKGITGSRKEWREIASKARTHPQLSEDRLEADPL